MLRDWDQNLALGLVNVGSLVSRRNCPWFDSQHYETMFWDRDLRLVLSLGKLKKSTGNFCREFKTKFLITKKDWTLNFQVRLMRPERCGPCRAAEPPCPATSGPTSPTNIWLLSSGTDRLKENPFTRKLKHRVSVWFQSLQHWKAEIWNIVSHSNGSFY